MRSFDLDTKFHQMCHLILTLAGLVQYSLSSTTTTKRQVPLREPSRRGKAPDTIDTGAPSLASDTRRQALGPTLEIDLADRT